MSCHFLLQGTFPLRDQTRVSSVTGRFFTTEPLGKPPYIKLPSLKLSASVAAGGSLERASDFGPQTLPSPQLYLAEGWQV